MSSHRRKRYIFSIDLWTDPLVVNNRPCTLFCRTLRQSVLISKKHPNTYRYFRSYPTVVAEQQRQLTEDGRSIIHPLSCFCLFWNTWMALVNLSHVCVSAFRLCFVLHPPGQRPRLHPVDEVLLALHILCFFDIVVNLQTGYIEDQTNIVLNRSRIAWHYMRSYFMLDLITCLPISYYLIHIGEDPRIILFAHIVPILRVLSLCRVTNSIVTFSKFFHAPYTVYGSIRNTILFFLSAHLCSCINYILGVIPYYWYGIWPTNYNRFLTMNSTTVPTLTISHRYKKSAFICLSAFFGTGFSTYTTYEPGEVITHSLILLYAALYMIYTMVFLIKVYFTRYNSEIRYDGLMNQLQEYMRHKQFPASLKKRVFAFYYYRYKGTYFREDTVLNSLSDQLRDEIVLHTCHKLVNKVSLFDELPAHAVGSILGYLRPEVYLPNDLIVRAGDFGDCMFFIANGTVAVFSLKGVEVCHLDDGSYFGEVALLMKDSKRMATVVAVEITQVYRLDADHFRYFIEVYQGLRERITALASKRMHETVVVDEEFRHEREREQLQAASEHDTYHSRARHLRTNLSGTSTNRSPSNDSYKRM